ncbi:MAG: PAC2 family protein [Dehalococcoidia bacterium]|jgi:proteasome assembly chaperone (PAC2) family protein
MKSGNIIFSEWPTLRKPDMVAAYLGWPDAAQVATGAVSYLINKLHATKFAEIKSDEYYDFATVRPSVNITSGLIQPLRMPVNGFYYWQNLTGERDLIIQTGIEPQLKWQSYVEAIADLAKYYNVHRIYAIGGLFDRIPHTRETHTSGLTNDQTLLIELEKANIEASNYQGPSSIHGLLLNVCAEKFIPALSIWGHVPFYIRAESNPMVCLEIVKKITELLQIGVDLGELKKAADNLFEMLNKLISANQQMSVFLKALEEQYDLEGSAPNTELEGTDQVIKDIEDFLRNQRYNG